MTSTTIDIGPPPSARRTLPAVLIGNALEFYDFLTFSFFATQISRCFFPGSSKQDALLLTLATFGAGFLTRPIGGVVLGRFADRAGRKPALQVSFGLMGIGVIGVALTPSHAAIGVAAPLLILLFRLIQGFALGGDVGATTAYLIESAPAHRRGLYVSLQYSTQAIAVLGAGLVGTALSTALTPPQLDAWGWRVALLIGASIVPLGLYLRRRLVETLPERAPTAVRTPLRPHLRVILLGLALLAFGTIGTYTIDYMATYAQATLHLSSTAGFGATVVNGSVGLVMCPLAGIASDRWGRRPVIVVGTLLLLVVTLPGYAVLSHWPALLPLLAITALLKVGHALAITPALVAVTEALPLRIRASGVAIIYALAITLFGGTTQFVIAGLIKLSGSAIAPAWYLTGAGLVGLIGIALLPETGPRRPPAQA